MKNREILLVERIPCCKGSLSISNKYEYKLELWFSKFLWMVSIFMKVKLYLPVSSNCRTTTYSALHSFTQASR